MGGVSVKGKIPRIVTFDIMRGFFLIAIINDHLEFFPNFLDWWGMRGELLTSTAEGFFLISGIVLGIVRGAKLIDAPFRDVTKIVLKRALTLYITYAVLVIAATLIGWYIYADNANLKYGILADHSWLQLIWQTLTFQYSYGWADYLRFYAIYIAISPLAFWLLRRGLWYVVVGVSFLVWFLFPLDYNTVPWQTLAILQPIPWELIFFNGLVIGFHWPAIAAWWQRHRRLLVRFVAIPVVVLGVATLLWNAYAVFANEFLAHTNVTQALSDRATELRNTVFRKESLTMPRFLLFMLWFWAGFFIVERFQRTIVKYTGWLLIPFGTNSLYVYTLHAIIMFFVHMYLLPGVPLFNFLVLVSIVGLIYAAIRTRFLMTIIPR